MKLLIHDLTKEEWDKVSASYEGWEVICDNGCIKSCVGCFGCWIKEPGECVIKDGYEKMGALIHKADEVTVISRYTYGGFSSFIKNVFDRSIGFVLPYFEIRKGEMHHKKRYPEDKPMTFIFRGRDLTDDDKNCARKYVEAVCTNLHGIVKDVVFEETSTTKDLAEKMPYIQSDDTTILLNCSLRGDKANSKMFLDYLESGLEGEVKRINLSTYINQTDELVRIFASAKKIVLSIPLYVDGIPSSTLRMMERIEQCSLKDSKKIYVIANMGFYESVQITNLMSMVRNWCDRCGFEYGGGVAIGAGEMVGSMMVSSYAKKGPSKNAALSLDKLSETINASSVMDDIYSDPFKFPRALYMFCANSGWPVGCKKNGLKRKDLLRKADAD